MTRRRHDVVLDRTDPGWAFSKRRIISRPMGRTRAGPSRFASTSMVEDVRAARLVVLPGHPARLSRSERD